jgi:hypothetical protein
VREGKVGCARVSCNASFLCAPLAGEFAMGASEIDGMIPEYEFLHPLDRNCRDAEISIQGASHGV